MGVVAVCCCAEEEELGRRRRSTNGLPVIGNSESPEKKPGKCQRMKKTCKNVLFKDFQVEYRKTLKNNQCTIKNPMKNQTTEQLMVSNKFVSTFKSITSRNNANNPNNSNN